MEKINRQKLKNAMLRANVGVVTLAKMANITQSHISKLLRKDCQVRLPTVGKIAKALQVDATNLLVTE